MTDRERIEAAPGWAIPNSDARNDVFAEVERLIRDAALRAWDAGCEEGEEAALEHATEYDGRKPKPFPADFQLVADKERAG